MSAFTYVRDGKISRAIKLLQDLAAKPVDHDTEAVVSLTLGNAYRAARNPTAAIEAYRHTRSIATPESAVYKEASAAIANAQ